MLYDDTSSLVARSVVSLMTMVQVPLLY
jgi:hypothetical protein